MPPAVPNTLVVTNDFPPAHGGAEQYVHNLVRHLPPERLTVVAPAAEGDRAFDEVQPFRVHRESGRFIAPTAATKDRIAALIRETEAQTVLLASGVATTGLSSVVRDLGVPFTVLTFGVEYWVAGIPGPAQLFRRQLEGASRVIVISEFIRRRVQHVVPQGIPLSLCPPGVDEVRFHPGVDPGDVRERHGLQDRPVVFCVSRLVRRKGQDMLIQGMDRIRATVPDATLLIVGEGPDMGRLSRAAVNAPRGSVVLAGPVPAEELPAYHAAADVFAMPCRSRLGGLEIEGFGIVFLEAAATGRASVAGDSGGAAEAVEDGVTGVVVDGRSPEPVARAVARLLADPATARQMGAAGRRRVEESFTWHRIADRIGGWLTEAMAP